ncbi:hypothetical protein LSTR_LSTR008449 [Laodelphax striatellus]|uniref:Reverse transcriptase zinc-binding domain-containing protein n=1 Tax=Laodelphax striatellus TaxID=195883 RepID=A0A482XT26_LAOST|nr:hypothetical protein LSTR_LSTR008449 [Laodelphax striatellus]
MHYIRLELGLNHIECVVLKRMLMWYLKIRRMGAERLPKICLERLLELNMMPTNKVKYNWVSQLNQKLSSAGLEDELHRVETKGDVIRLVEKYKRNKLLIDINRVLNSRYNGLFQHISSLGTGELYLNYDKNIWKMRLISQLRLAQPNFCSIYHKGCVAKFSREEICMLCNQLAENSLLHALFGCPTFEVSRRMYLVEYLQEDQGYEEKYKNLLFIDSPTKLDKIFAYFSSYIKYGQFVIDLE